MYIISFATDIFLWQDGISKRQSTRPHCWQVGDLSDLGDLGMVLIATVGRWRSITVYYHQQGSLRTRPASCFRFRSRIQSPTTIVAIQRETWKRARLSQSRGDMRDRSHHYRDHHGHAMPLEEVQGLLLPPSRTGEFFSFSRDKSIWDIFSRFYNVSLTWG